MGHPDKMADQISDGILDAILSRTPRPGRLRNPADDRTGRLAGEITTTAMVDYPTIVRKIVARNRLHVERHGLRRRHLRRHGRARQAIARHRQGVNEDARRGKDIGAGDQGLMFGYASNETPELMPLPIALSHRIINRLTELRKNGTLHWLRPDSKSQVTIEYEDGTPIRSIPSSFRPNTPGRPHGEIRKAIKEQVIQPVLPKNMLDGKIEYHINPTGQFVVGGPHGDAGVTGRKIIVDTYGGMGRHGGGAFSGKDPTKVDRSAAYMARHVAKNVVAAGLADRCEIQLAYAIGVSEPVSVHVDTYGTGQIADSQIAELIRKIFPLTPVRHHQASRPAPADLPQDRQRRPLRSVRARVHLGTHRGSRNPQASRQRVGRRLSVTPVSSSSACVSDPSGRTPFVFPRCASDAGIRRVSPRGQRR